MSPLLGKAVGSSILVSYLYQYPLLEAIYCFKVSFLIKESIVFSSLATNILLRSMDSLIKVPEVCDIGLRACSCC